jgi:cytochrome c-type biogenesis protein CcmE
MDAQQNKPVSVNVTGNVTVNLRRRPTFVRFGIVIGLIVVAFGYIAWTGVQEGKSYYVTIAELHKQGQQALGRRLRVAGNVQPGSIKQIGTNADFTIVEQDPQTKETQTLRVSYKGMEPPPDTFKDNAQALVAGEFGQDGVFHAKEIQAKCASKYAAQPGTASAAAPSGSNPAGPKAY